MQTLFSPAIKLMNRLSYSGKTLVFSMLSLTAILVLITSLYVFMSRPIEQDKEELKGLEYLKSSLHLMNAVQKHRGTSAGVLSGLAILQDKRSRFQDDVDRSMALLQQTIPALLLEDLDFSTLVEHWEQIKLNAGKSNVADDFAEHVSLVGQIQQLHENLSERSQLLYDNEPHTYFLIVLISQDLPRILEDLGQVRGLSLSVLAKRALSESERMQLLFLKNSIESSHVHINYILGRCTQYSVELSEPLQRMRDSLDAAVHLLTQVVLSDILQGDFSTDPQYFFSSVMLVIDGVYQQVFESLEPAISVQIRRRIQISEHWLITSITVSTFLFCLTIYLTLAAHLSASRSIHALLKAAQGFKDGDFNQHIEVLSQDEIGKITTAFNEMLLSFNMLLKTEAQNRKRLASIIDTALDAVVQMDDQGIVCVWNRQAERIFGWAVEDVLGKPLHTVITPERLRDGYQTGIEQYRLNAFDDTMNRRVETIGLHRDGNEFAIELAIAPISIDDRIEFSVFIRDISSEKQALKTLMESEQRYRRLFESSRVAIVTLSPLHGIVSGNLAAIALFGCQDEVELLGQDPASLSPEFQYNGQSSAELAESKIQQAIEQGFCDFEWMHRRLNGETFFAEVQLALIEDGDAPLLQATVRDISDRVQVKKALMQSEARMRGIFRTMADAVVHIDPFGKILMVNDATLELFDYLEEELIGHNVACLMPEPHAGKHDEYLKVHRETHRRAIIGRRVELEAKRKDGTLIPIELSVNELIDDAGNTFIGVIQDLRRRKAVEQAHAKAREEAEHLAAMRSEFLANMSHEIRTPLNAILGLAKINLRDAQRDHPSSMNNQRIYDAGIHLLSVVNDILDFSKIDSGKMTIDNHSFHLMGVIDDVISLVELRAQEKNLQMVVDKAKDLPEWVMGDALRLRQILVNLLANAVKFTEQGYVTLTVRRVMTDILFTVSDSGVGMTDEQMQRLFNAFEQADGSTTRKFGGSGLGLAISRNLARLMDGDITVRSQLGVGSQFCVKLPMPVAEPDLDMPKDSAEQGVRLAGVRILAADDVELNRMILDDLLLHEGAHVVFAENGQQALDRLEELGFCEIDLVLMDIQMPVMDGHEAARKIKESAPELPIIGLTAHVGADERDRCLASGMRACVTKPIDTDQLVAAIRQHLPHKPEILPNSLPDIEQKKTEEAPAKSALIDWVAVHQRFEGRQDFINRLIENALDGSQNSNLEKLRTAAEQADYASIKFVAHSLKGLAGVFHAEDLLNLAQDTEQAAKNQAEGCIDLAYALANHLQDLLNELREQQNESKST